LTEFIAKRLPDNYFSIEQEGVAYSYFKAIYEQVCNLIQQGQEIPKIDVSHRARPIQNPEVARAHLYQIKQHIGV